MAKMIPFETWIIVYKDGCPIPGVNRYYTSEAKANQAIKQMKIWYGDTECSTLAEVGCYANKVRIEEVG